jgi:hypothetical protein
MPVGRLSRDAGLIICDPAWATFGTPIPFSAHDERRKVLHFNVTDCPSAAWTAQQLTEAFPYRHQGPTEA